MERRPLRPKQAATRRAPRSAASRNAAGYDPLHNASSKVASPLDHLDPDLRAYLRAPYDPLNGAQPTRFVARGLLQQPPAYGWMRPFALIIALILLVGVIGNIVGLLGLIGRGTPQSLAALLQLLVVAGPLGAFGAVLLWRVIRGWGR